MANEREYSVKITADASGFQAAFKAASGLVGEFSAGLKDGFREGLAEVEKSTAGVKRFGDEAEKAGGKSLSSFESIALKVTGIVGALDLASRAMSAIGGAIEGVFAGIDRGGMFDDLSKRIGVSVESLSSLELAAQAGGVSLDSLGTGMQVLSRNMAEAAGGSKEAQAGFAAFGIAVSDANGNLKSGEEVLLQIADRFAGAEDGAAKTAAAMDLLGKSGTQLIPFLNEGAAGLQKWQQLSSDLGLTLTAELAGAMDRIGDSMQAVGAVATGVQNQLAIGMAPALVALSDAAVDLVRNLGIADGGVRDFGATIGSAVVQGVDAALGALNTFVETVYSLGLGDALLQVFGAAFSALEDMAAAQGRVIGLKFVQSFAAAVDSLIDSIPGLMLLDKPFTNLAQGSIDEATAQVRALADSFSNLGQGSPELAKVSSALEAARARLAQFNPAVQENDAHVNAWKASMQGAANTLPVVAKGTDAAAAAATKAADAIEQLRERFAEQIRSAGEAVDKMDAQNAALEQIIEGNLSAADAQKVLNDATAEGAARAALNGKATADEAAEIRKKSLDLAEATQKNREYNATRNAQVQTGYLQQEAAILQKVLDGTKTQIEAEHELAVLRQERNDVDGEWAEKLVTAQEKLEETQGAVKELGEVGKDAWKGIDDAFQQTLDGLINGTLDMQDIWKSFTLGLLKDFATSMGGVSGILGKVFDGFKGLTDGTGSVGDLLKGLGGGTDRFVISAGTPNERVDYGAVSGAAVQGGATAYSLFQPTDDTKLEGLIAKGTESGVINASNAIGQVVGTIAGAVLSIYLGPLGGIVGAAIGSALSGLIAGSVNRETFLTGKYTGFVGFQQTFDPFHAWLTDLVLNLPTLGLAMRKGAEAVLDESETFAALQSKYGDITVRSGGPKDVYRNNLTGSETARSRGFTDGQVDLTEGATASIFGQISKDELSQDSGRLGEAMGQIMAEFLSRGLEEGADFEPMFDKLREFAHEAGIDLFSSMRMLKDVFADSMSAAMTWAHMDPLAAAAQGARAYAEALVGATEVFEGDFPAGVNTTAIALRYMTKDGVNAFGELDDAAKDTLLNLSDDTELTMTTVQRLVEQGFTIDDEAFKEALQSIAQSAQFIGQNSAAFFDGPSVFAGIESMGQKLRDTIKQAVISTGTEQLFDKTRIAESFSPVYEVLDKLKAGDFNLLDASGNASFRDEMVTAIAAGKANLQEYIPQLRALRDAAEEVDKAIEEALKPSTEEAFWQNISETFKSNEEAINGMAEGMFEVAVQAERAGAGLGQQATRDAMSSKVDEGIFTATQAAVSTTAGESPEAQRLAALTTEFQFKVKAALKDGIVSAAELADLTALKQKMHDAGKEVADGISESTAALDDLFKADRLKEAIDAAVGTLKDAVGGASGSMFDTIKNGGSVEEGVKAFGESFRGSVRDNVLQGMQEALVQSVVMEGALATLMGQMKQAVSVALSDGFIDADEQAFIDGLAKGIGTATDSALTALEPTLNTLGGIAQTVAGNTDKAEAKVDDLDKSTKNASYGVDEMARRAARSLEQVGDAIPPDTLNTIQDGMGSLSEALGKDGGTEAIADGVGALKDALGGTDGPATEISAGIGALKDALGPVAAGSGNEMKAGLAALRAAFGPEASPEQIGAGLEKIKAALDAQMTDPIAQGVGAIRDALGGETGGGVADAAAKVIGAFGAGGSDGVVGAAGQVVSAMQDQLAPATGDAASALRDGFVSALGDAGGALGDLASTFANFTLPTWDPVALQFRANGGPVAAGTMAVVGEAGPELMVAHGGGGATIIPLKGIPMMANGGTIGASSGSAVIPLGGSSIIAAIEAVVEAFGALTNATAETESSARAAATGLDGVASSAEAGTSANLIGAPHTRRRFPLGGPEEPNYVPITTDNLEPEDLQRIEETWKLLTDNFDKAFSNKSFVNDILNNPNMAGDQRLDQLILKLRLSGENPDLQKALRDIGALVGGGTTVNDTRWYAKMLEEVGSKEFVNFLHDRRTNAELFQESQEQVVPGGGKLPPVDYLEYSDKVRAFMDKYGDETNRGQVGPLDFKTRAEGSLTQWLDPEKIKSVVTLGLDQAIKDFAAGGSVEDMREAIKTSVNQSMYDGLVEGMISALALEDQQAILSAAITDAMSDGFLDAADVESLTALAEEVAAGLAGSVEEMGPAFKAIAEAFGIDLGDSADSAIEKATETAKGMIGNGLKSALQDPANLNYETFATSLRQAVYGNIVNGMVDAFVDAAVIQGALAPMLAVISDQFKNLGIAIAAGSAEGIAAASAIILTEIGKIANIIDDPAFKAAIQTLLDLGHDVAKGLGLDLNTATDGVNKAADGFQNAADAAANACTGECDAEKKLVTTQEKLIALDDYGRVGGSSDTYYEYVERPTRGASGADIPDTLGGGNGRYGDGDWQRSRTAAEREAARRRRWDRNHTYYDPDIPQMAEGGIVTGPTFALIGESGPEAVIPLSGAQSESALVSELRALREELRAQGEKTVDAIEADKHTEVKMNEQTLIDAWTSAKRIADKAGIQFGA